MRVLGAGFAVIVVLGGLGGLWACSSFTTTPADTPTSDASADTLAASPDAGARTDARPFCQDRDEPLCVDFEADGVYRGDWALNQDFSAGPSKAERDPTMGKDSLASLHSTLLAGIDDASATLELGTSTIADRAFLEADVYVKHPAASFGAQLTVMAIQRNPDSALIDVEAKIVWVNETTYQFVLYAQTADSTNDATPSAIVAFDTWVHLRLESDLKGTGMGSASITVDQGPRSSVAIARRDAIPNEHTRAVLGLSRFQAATTTSIDLFIDNVFFGPLPP